MENSPSAHDTDEEFPYTEKVRAKPVGPTVGIFIILLMLILGGLYFWMKQIAELKNARQQEGAVIQVGEPDVTQTAE